MAPLFAAHRFGTRLLHPHAPEECPLPQSAIWPSDLPRCIRHSCKAEQQRRRVSTHKLRVASQGRSSTLATDATHWSWPFLISTCALNASPTWLAVASSVVVFHSSVVGIAAACHCALGAGRASLRPGDVLVGVIRADVTAHSRSVHAHGTVCRDWDTASAGLQLHTHFISQKRWQSRKLLLLTSYLVHDLLDSHERTIEYGQASHTVPQAKGGLQQRGQLHQQAKTNYACQVV